MQYVTYSVLLWFSMSILEVEPNYNGNLIENFQFGYKHLLVDRYILLQIGTG
jgi:hypothetical protein